MVLRVYTFLFENISSKEDRLLQSIYMMMKLERALLDARAQQQDAATIRHHLSAELGGGHTAW